MEGSDRGAKVAAERRDSVKSGEYAAMSVSTTVLDGPIPIQVSISSAVGHRVCPAQLPSTAILSRPERRLLRFQADG